MNKPTLMALTLATICALGPKPVEAQQTSIEIRGSLPKALGEFGDPGGVEASGDVGFGADLVLNVSPRLSFYGGWGQDRFDCDGCEGDDRIVSRGFEGGAKLVLASGAAALPWVRVGAAVHEMNVRRGSLDATSNAAVGLQAGVGIDIPLGNVLSFTPALRYQAYEAEFDVLGDYLVAQEDVTYLTLDLGLHVHLGR